jgi:hypothetical protein
MGRNSIIPHSYDDQVIKFRIPYTMPGELVVEASASGEFFPDGAFNYNIDKPFEIERMIVRLTAIDAEGEIIEAQPTTLQKRVRLTITDTSKNEDLTKARTPVENLISSLAGGDGSWEWYSTYTIVRSEGFTIGVDTSTFPDGTEKVRIDISFQGNLIVIQPASETR